MKLRGRRYMVHLSLVFFFVLISISIMLVNYPSRTTSWSVINSACDHEGTSFASITGVRALWLSSFVLFMMSKKMTKKVACNVCKRALSE